MRHQFAARVPPQFFGSQPSHSLHKSTFDLADVDGRVPLPGLAWGETCTIDGDFGADSLELMQLATALSQALHMYETGAEEYFLVRRTLDDWVDIAAASLNRYAAKLSFVTSGSTGIPKTCSHTLAVLLQEACTSYACHWTQFYSEIKSLLFLGRHQVKCGQSHAKCADSD